ncbi:MAG TPA: plasmid pRiA4b ORF-3 family protein [Gemmatimonadales bacterium]|jgi:hypothetical protein
MSRPRIRFGEGRVFQLRVEFDGVTPAVWRRLLVSGRASLHEVHDVIERAMGRDAESGYTMRVDGVEYQPMADEPTRGREGEATSLDDLALYVGARFEHLAEAHVEPWHHVVTVEQLTPRLVGQRLPSCIAGGRAAPPDDCAGPGAYRELLAALRDPLDPRNADIRSWLPEHFDPEYANVTAINAALARVPKRRPAA